MNRLRAFHARVSQSVWANALCTLLMLGLSTWAFVRVVGWREWGESWGWLPPLTYLTQTLLFGGAFARFVRRDLAYTRHIAFAPVPLPCAEIPSDHGPWVRVADVISRFETWTEEHGSEPTDDD